MHDLGVGEQREDPARRLGRGLLAPPRLAVPVGEIAHQRVEQRGVCPRACPGPLEQHVLVEATLGEQRDRRIQRFVQGPAKVSVVVEIPEVVGQVSDASDEVGLGRRRDARMGAEERLQQRGPAALEADDEDGEFGHGSPASL